MPKVFPSDLIDTQFEDKEVSDVGMIEAITEENTLFKIFIMKDPDYAMKIMGSWMTLDELDGARTRIYYIYISGMKDTKQFTERKPFESHFRYIHQVYDHNYRENAPINL